MKNFNSPEGGESKSKLLSDSLQILRDFGLHYNDRMGRDKRMKVKVREEYKMQLHKDLGLSLEELNKWSGGVIAEACNLIHGNDLESFYRALDTSEGKVHNFLQMMEKFFKEKRYIKKENKDKELADVLGQCKTLSEALHFLKDFVLHHDDRSSRDSRLKKTTWKEYKEAFSSKLGIDIKELNKWDKETVVSACGFIKEPNIIGFARALHNSSGKAYEFLRMLKGVFEKNKYISKAV